MAGGWPCCCKKSSSSSSSSSSSKSLSSKSSKSLSTDSSQSESVPDCSVCNNNNTAPRLFKVTVAGIQNRVDGFGGCCDQKYNGTFLIEIFSTSFGYINPTFCADSRGIGCSWTYYGAQCTCNGIEGNLKTTKFSLIICYDDIDNLVSLEFSINMKNNSGIDSSHIIFYKAFSGVSSINCCDIDNLNIPWVRDCYLEALFTVCRGTDEVNPNRCIGASGATCVISAIGC